MQENISHGLTVALVGVPLCTAIAISSGARPMMGLQSLIYGSFIGGFCAGSDFTIFSVAGSLINVLKQITSQNENGCDLLAKTAIASGVMLQIVNFLDIDKYCTLIPFSVLEGFSFGVAITIGFGQFNFALGLVRVPHHQSFIENVVESLKHAPELSMNAFVPFLVFFIMLMFLTTYFPGKPWVILVAVLGTIEGYITKNWFPAHKPDLLYEQYPGMLDVETALFDFTYLKYDYPASVILLSAMKVSFVALLGTIITARLADNARGTRFDQTAEVRCLSLGNLISGFFGGTPVMGALVLTGVNLQSGGTDKLCQLCLSISSLLIILIFMPAFVYTPLACMSSILMVSAYRLVPVKPMISLWQLDRSEFWILIITAVCFVQYDGAVGLTVGAIISILRHAIKESSQLRVESVVLDPLGWLVITSKEALTYVNASQFETQVEEHLSSGLEHNVLDLTSVPFMDMDAIVSLQQIQKYAAKQGQKVYILEPQGSLARECIKCLKWKSVVALKDRSPIEILEQVGDKSLEEFRILNQLQLQTMNSETKSDDNYAKEAE